jgi:tetratricopeptide (TPR) repeat protein
VALDAVIEVLGTANHQAWEHAAQIVESLPDIAACTSSLSNDDSLHDSNLEPIEKAVAQGKALLSAGEYDQAARALAQAAAMAKTAGATRLQAVATTELGAAQHMRNQFGRSEASFREALALAIEVDDLRTTIRSLVGTIHILGSHQDKLAEAVKLATIARAYLDRRPYIDSQNVMMELHLARAHLDAGNHQEGLEHVRTARELVDGIDELPSVRIYLHLTIAATLFDAKQYDDALLHYEVALEETRRSRGEGHPMYGRILASMGTANLNLDRPEEGLKQLRQALAIAEQNHEPLAIPGRLYRKLGHASRRLKRWNEAIQYADRARILFLQGEGPTSTDTIEATIELSKAHRNGGDPGDAWQLLESVDVDPLKAGDRAAIEHERGHVLQKMGRFSAAARAFERAAIAFPEGHRDRACNEKGLREVDLRLPRAERPSPAG